MSSNSPLDKELLFHIEERVADLIRSGLTEPEARRRVRLEFGTLPQVQDDCRDVHRFHFFSLLLQDLHYALRGLRKNPGFALTTIGTLALGIGANTAIFSLISGVLLRPLPFHDPTSLVQITQSSARNGDGPVPRQDIHAWRQHSTSFEGIFAYDARSKNMQGAGAPERVAAVRAEPGLLPMLGAPLIAGRTFAATDPPNAAVIAEGLWQRRFGSDPASIGRTIFLDGEAFTITGIVPAEFQFPYRAAPTDIWIPWILPPSTANSRSRVGPVAARLKPGVSLAKSRAELDAISASLPRLADQNYRRDTNITPLSEVILGDVRPALLTLWGAVGVVLLIACANVMNLLLARGATRARELALRAALGASRARLIRQLLTESLLLSLAGAAAGLLLALLSSNLLVQLASQYIPRANEIAFDWRVFAFLLIAALGAGIFFGLLPAFSASRLELQTTLTPSASGASGSRLRDALVIAEIAMAFVLVIGAGLLLQAFLRLQSTPSGFTAENVLTLHMSYSIDNYKTPAAYGRYLGELESRLIQIPGVESAGFIQYLPLQNWNWWAYFTITGRPAPPPGQQPKADLRYVSPGYFAALGIPIRRGRNFDARDTAAVPIVILINEALARRYFPNQDPVGQSLNRGAIVGVVGDVRQAGLDKPATPEIFYAFVQNTAATSDAGVSLVLRSRLRPDALARAARATIHQVNPNQALFKVQTMADVILQSLGGLTLYVWLIGFFAALALLLAIAGVYGVVSYSVARRTQEFAVRIALGASRGQIVRVVLSHGSILLAVGLAIGVAGALALSRTLKSLSSSVASPDPLTLASVTLLLAAVAWSACLIPARRATQIDPNLALKSE